MSSVPSKANRGPSAGPENRRALIVAAREVFATGGLAAPLSSVARKAGVGQGSLYRHFPDRIALAVAVFDENISELEALAKGPDGTLDDFIDHIIEQTLVSTALIDLVRSTIDDERVDHLGVRLRSVAVEVVAREKARGTIAHTVAVDDVILAVSMLAGVIALTRPDDRREVAHRAWALFHAAFAPA